MKLQSFYLLTVFFMCLTILKSQAYKVTIIKDTLGVLCRFWIEDANHNRIAGDGEGKYHSCGSGDNKVIEFDNQQYYIAVEVEGNLQKEKIRGPFDGDHSCTFYGDVYHFELDC